MVVVIPTWKFIAWQSNSRHLKRKFKTFHIPDQNARDINICTREVSHLKDRLESITTQINESLDIRIRDRLESITIQMKDNMNIQIREIVESQLKNRLDFITTQINEIFDLFVALSWGREIA